MDILILIAFFLLHCFTAFLLCFAFDIPKIWKNNHDIALKKPELNDLNDGFDYSYNESLSYNQYLDFRQIQNKYSDSVISLANRYFFIKSRVENMIHYETGEWFLSCLITQVSSLLLVLDQIDHVFVSSTNWLWKILSVLMCTIGCTIVYLIFNKKFKIQSFQFGYEDLIDMYKKQKNNQFPISEESDFNNYVIKCHIKYLYSIENSTMLRYYIRRGLIGLSGVIYIFFFMKMPYR